MSRAREGSGRDVALPSLGDRVAAALEAYRDGATGPLAEVVHELTPVLWGVVRSQGVARDAAEDVVQGVWLAFVRHAQTIRDPQAALKWLVVSARRAAWRAAGNERSEAARTRAFEAPGVDPPEVPDSRPDPAEVVVTDERDAVLWSVYRTLPERCRLILRFVALADRPDYRAISEATGIGLTSVGVTRGRCLAKLRNRLDEEGWAWT